MLCATQRNLVYPHAGSHRVALTVPSAINATWWHGVVALTRVLRGVPTRLQVSLDRRFRLERFDEEIMNRTQGYIFKAGLMNLYTYTKPARLCDPQHKI